MMLPLTGAVFAGFYILPGAVASIVGLAHRRIERRLLIEDAAAPAARRVDTTDRVALRYAASPGPAAGSSST